MALRPGVSGPAYGRAQNVRNPGVAYNRAVNPKTATVGASGVLQPNALLDRMKAEGVGTGVDGAGRPEQYGKQSVYTRDQSGALAGSPDFRGNFEKAMADAIQKRDVGNADPTQRINMAADRIAQSEGGAAADLQKRAAASGYGTGGGVQAGLQGLYEKFSGQKADSAREVTQDVEDQNAAAQRAEEARMLQALGIAGNQLNSDRQYGLSQQELALRQQTQKFNEGQVARQNKQAKQRGLYETLSALNAGFQSGGDGGRGGRAPMGGPQVIGGGALSELGHRQATGTANGQAMDRLKKILGR